DPAHPSTMGMEDGKPGADLVRKREEVQLAADPPVITSLRLHQALEECVERLLREPRRAVHTLQLLVALVASPVHAGDAEELDRIEPPAIRHVRPATQVDEIAGTVHAEPRHVWQTVDDVHLERLIDALEQGPRLLARQHLRW